VANFEIALAKLLINEGGYALVPKTGECVNMGITHWFLRNIGWPGMDTKAITKAANPQEIQIIKNLKPEEVRELYKAHFWDYSQIGYIHDQALADKVFDLSVNQGPHQAALELQRAINHDSWPEVSVKEDGKIGHRTIEAANAISRTDALGLLEALRREAKAVYLVSNPAESRDAWLARLAKA
jgi:lysozyme family protein